jgi:hypothetical protein
MKKLQINLLSCGHRAYRFPFTTKAIQELSCIKNVDKIVVCIHGEPQAILAWRKYFSKNPVTFECKLYQYTNSNYLDRVRAAHDTPCKYSCKLDDDVLISRHVWDYMIDNLDAISDKNPMMAPILTNGMPTVELFVKDFLNEEDRNTAYSLFLKQMVPVNLWGLNYTSINEKISSMKKWDDREYWDFVSTANTHWDTNPVPWHYFNVRGVHPARFSLAYNLFIAQKIFDNREKFFGKNNYYFDTYNAPYFTNNTFISETKYWKDTLPLFDDGWDEGQLSLRLKMDNTSILYVRNGFGIHMAYGMTEGHTEIEKTYTDNI